MGKRVQGKKVGKAGWATNPPSALVKRNSSGGSGGSGGLLRAWVPQPTLVEKKIGGGGEDP